MKEKLCFFKLITLNCDFNEKKTCFLTSILRNHEKKSSELVINTKIAIFQSEDTESFYLTLLSVGGWKNHFDFHHIEKDTKLMAWNTTEDKFGPVLELYVGESKYWSIGLFKFQKWGKLKTENEITSSSRPLTPRALFQKFKNETPSFKVFHLKCKNNSWILKYKKNGSESYLDNSLLKTEFVNSAVSNPTSSIYRSLLFKQKPDLLLLLNYKKNWKSVYEFFGPFTDKRTAIFFKRNDCDVSKRSFQYKVDGIEKPEKMNFDELGEPLLETVGSNFEVEFIGLVNGVTYNDPNQKRNFDGNMKEGIPFYTRVGIIRGSNGYFVVRSTVGKYAGNDIFEVYKIEQHIPFIAWEADSNDKVPMVHIHVERFSYWTITFLQLKKLLQSKTENEIIWNNFPTLTPLDLFKHFSKTLPSEFCYLQFQNHNWTFLDRKTQVAITYPPSNLDSNSIVLEFPTLSTITQPDVFSNLNPNFLNSPSVYVENINKENTVEIKEECEEQK